MPKNFKFHAIALASICAIVVLVSSLMKQDEPVIDPNGPSNGRAIEVFSATWGKNCDATIDTILAARAATPPEKDANGVLVPQPKVEKAKKDNVLSTVSAVCNGHVTCELAPNSTNMGIEPAESCYKQLEIGYRCFSFDRMNSISIGQGKSTTIDCNEKSDSKPKSAVPATQAN